MNQRFHYSEDCLHRQTSRVPIVTAPLPIANLRLARLSTTPLTGLTGSMRREGTVV